MLIKIHISHCLISCYIFLLLLLFSSTGRADELSHGAKLYQRCAVCHLATAKGVPGMFPPLIQRLGPLASTQQGRDYLVMVVQAGLIGSIHIDGVTYQGIMPAQGSAMKEESMAVVLNYLLENFNSNTLADNWQRFTSSEVASITSRYPKTSGQEVYVLRQAVFPKGK